MDNQPYPADEVARLAELRSLTILDTPLEERFDRVTRVAQRLFHVPIALVSLVDDSRLWFKSHAGLPISEIPRTGSFCSVAILGKGALVVPDSRVDARFAANPLVCGDANLRFYAGRPLRLRGGSALGTLCIIDHVPRDVTEDDMGGLDDLAAIVEDEMRISAMSAMHSEMLVLLDAANRRASVDPVTGLWNRAAILGILGRELERGAREGTRVSVGIADIDSFKAVNDVHGHVAGDQVLAEVARRLRAAVRPYDAVGRCGGDEFLIVFGSAATCRADGVAERILSLVGDTPIRLANACIATSFSLGVALTTPGDRASLGEVLELADRALYRAKANGRNRVEYSDVTG